MIKPCGSFYLENKNCLFRVWAPFRKKVELELETSESTPIKMIRDGYGYWETECENIPPSTAYHFKLDDEISRPDPASRDQSAGIHSWSKTYKDNFNWTDNSWRTIHLGSMIIYELHTGTFTEEGSFEAIIPKLDYLLDLGVNTIELMPVCQFPGTRNWGYDGVYPYAVQDSYGGADGLKKLVNACHAKGIAVILDVVYNHLGPEGNYLQDFGPYFTTKYNTPWGAALNFDDVYSDHVRSFFLHAALRWLEEFHIDGLRLDAVHAIFDNSARHFLKELREEVGKLEEKIGRNFYLIAESDLNDIKLLKPFMEGGYNLDGQWADDFHHAVHTLATAEKKGYYSDFGKVEDLAKTFRQAFVYDGTYSEYRKRKIGSDPSSQHPGKFIVCIQNHDQVGNRMLGERLSHIVSFEKTKICAIILFCSPYVPMLFMGEEYGERNPFQYFVSHSDKELIEAVRQGRKKEFQSFEWQGEIPDPQSEETFRNSTLQWNYENDPEGQILWQLYKHLIHLRKKGEFSAFSERNVQTLIDEENKLLTIISNPEQRATPQICACFNFNENTQKMNIPGNTGEWKKIISSADRQWGGSSEAKEIIKAGNTLDVSAESAVIYQKIQK